MTRALFLLLATACVQRSVLLDIDTSTCEAHLTCLGTYDPDEAIAREAEYGRGGACWNTEDDAATCTRFCEAELARDHDAHPSTPACDPEALGLDPPGLQTLFGQSVTTQLTPVEPGCMTGATWSERLAFGRSDGRSTTVTLVEGGFWQRDVTYTCEADWFVVECTPLEVTVQDGQRVTTSIDVRYDGSLRGLAVFTVDYADENGESTCEASLSGPL